MMLRVSFVIRDVSSQNEIKGFPASQKYSKPLYPFNRNYFTFYAIQKWISLLCYKEVTNFIKEYWNNLKGHDGQVQRYENAK